MDMALLRAEVTPTVPVEGIDAVRERLKESLKIGTNLSFHVIIEPPGSLPRYQLKAKRFKDMREERADD